MEVLVMVGRDCKVGFQSATSARIRAYQTGLPLIREGLVIPCEELRDLIFAGKSLSFANRPSRSEWTGTPLLVTRDYRPLYDDAGRIYGIVSLGFSHQVAMEEIAALRDLVAELESPTLPNELCGGSHLGAMFPQALSGSQRLARRLRRFLPPLLH